MKRRLLVIAAVALTAWVLVLASQRSFRPATRPAPAKPSVVTLDEYSRIAPGMTYEDCVRVVGANGTPYGSSASPEPGAAWPEWISYVWRNDSDSYVTVSFHHGKVDRARAFKLE
jgi:hypothetical protein